MNTINVDDYMEDGLGRLVPISKVEEIDKIRDELVRDLVAEAKELQAKMISFKRRAYSEMAAFMEVAANDHGVTFNGKKGNRQFTSFDHNLMVKVQISDQLTCDEKLMIAKEIIDSLLKEWTDRGRDEIKILVNDAFAVDQQGKVNIRKILTLRRHAIKDPKWLEAMDLISESLQVSGSKSYFRVYERTGPEGKYINIPLDFAAL